MARSFIRFASGTNGRSSGPVYSALGRMILPSSRCSMTWAAQPAVRAITNSGVNIGVGSPDVVGGAVYQSRLGNIRFTSHITDSMRSQTWNRL